MLCFDWPGCAMFDLAGCCVVIGRRHLEKSQRIEAILASLQATGAEAAQLQEVEEMITAPERQQLEALKHHINKYDTHTLTTATFVCPPASHTLTRLSNPASHTHTHTHASRSLLPSVGWTPVRTRWMRPYSCWSLTSSPQAAHADSHTASDGGIERAREEENEKRQKASPVIRVYRRTSHISPCLYRPDEWKRPLLLETNRVCVWGGFTKSVCKIRKEYMVVFF